jgi:peptide subunit release factor 1 (eRF1)
MFDWGKEKIDSSCPECNYKNKVPFKDFAKEKTIICAGCGQEIKLKDHNNSTKKSIQSVNDSIKDLNNTIKKISK